jgi:ABC-type branched-chain amino acid transport systems, periplasmic component
MPPARTCSKALLDLQGQIVGRELTAWPNQLDFSAELSKARAAKPDAIFAFYPGGAGIQFVTQYAQSGMKGQIPLYTAFTIDDLSLRGSRTSPSASRAPSSG